MADDPARPRPPRRVLIHTDGAARGNPGPSAIGIVVRDETGRVIYEASRCLGVNTNNEAEYMALLLALEAARDLGAQEIAVRCDSELLVKQMKGEYRVKHPNLKPLYTKARKLVSGFRDFDIRHVRREHNREADALANRAIDERAET